MHWLVFLDDDKRYQTLVSHKDWQITQLDFDGARNTRNLTDRLKGTEGWQKKHVPHRCSFAPVWCKWGDSPCLLNQYE